MLKFIAVIVVLDAPKGPFWELFKSFAAPLIFGSATVLSGPFLIKSWNHAFRQRIPVLFLGNGIERPQ